MFNLIKVRKYGRKLVILLIIALCVNTFGAVVSDNDGAAFITKAEFDSLKNDFQAQIDNYNTSIDNKIDGAIAAYLAGINVRQKETIETKLKSLQDNLKIKGINNLSSPSVVNKFTPVPQARVDWSTGALLAANNTATMLNNVTGDNREWGFFDFSLIGNGTGYGLYGDKNGNITSSVKDTYINLSLNSLIMYSYGGKNMVGWVEQVNDASLGYNENYKNTVGNAPLRVLFFMGKNASVGAKLLGVKRNKDGVPGAAGDAPMSVDTTKYTNSQCDWQRRGYINTIHAGGRTIVESGSNSATHVAGDNYLFISAYEPSVLLLNDDKKNYKEYKDTIYDTTRMLTGSFTSKYAGAEWRANVNYNTKNIYLLIPPIGPSNIESGNTNKQYWYLNQLKSDVYTKLLDESINYSVGFGDGFPLAYLKSSGQGTFSLKIKDIEDRKNEKDEVIYSEEKFSDYEVYVSTEPFSKVIDIKKTLPLTIKVNGTKVDYVPRETTATISFKTDKPKQQLYLWWQGKGSKSGGMLSELSKLTFVADD